jgi:hypothetical protein
MPLKGQAFWVPYTCLDGDNLPLAGDLAQHTINWWADGTDAEATNNQGGVGKHIEIGGGEYAILITAAEADCISGALTGASSTTDAVIVPKGVFTEGLLAGTVDGVTVSKILQLVLASLVNVIDPVGNDVLIYARDGTTLLATVTLHATTPGKRTASVIE